MPPRLSSVIREAEEVLEEVFRSFREECANPDSVLCETDRNRFVEEEESIREQLKEASESESKGWRNLLCLPSPQAVRCLEAVEELRRRFKEDVRAKVRTRIIGMGNPSSSRRQSSAFNSTGARTPELDTGLPLADSHSEPANAIITSPLNMRCSVSEPSELVVYPTAQNDRDYISDLNEAISTPLETSSDRSRDSGRRRRRSPPPPPRPRRMLQSSTSDLSSETTSDAGSGSPRRSQSIRRPAPPPPQSPKQSRIPRSPINGSFPPPGAFSPNIAMMSSISELTQHLDKIVASVVNESLSGQGQGGKGRRRSDYVVKTNCMDINGSNVEGPTLSNGGYKNSGAVIHKTVSSAQAAR